MAHIGDVDVLDRVATARKKAAKADAERLRWIKSSRHQSEEDNDRARTGNMAPSPMRQQHGSITRAKHQIQDARGEIGDPWRAVTLLERWERDEQITPEMRLAGEHFQSRFRSASLDPLKAADMGRIGGGQSIAKHSGSVAAQRAIRNAMDDLGGIGSTRGSGAWLVLGCELSIRQWTARESWKGRPLHHEAAKRVLIEALGVLAKHFGC